jgi:hypothetical protein
VTTQVSAVQKTNYRSIAPGFVNRAAYDLRPLANALVTNAGSVPGVSAAGVSLKPLGQYRHVAGGSTRSVLGNIDIGAYEAL